ncbi:hypothetical protein ABZ470_23770 [Streptosporangium sp. NPDC020072]|uniref:hypothetical protein n=1 Tax=Streptosporangium sp. NPDC020072 TaxID=3154788 RepID=UPI0034123E19
MPRVDVTVTVRDTYRATLDIPSEVLERGNVEAWLKDNQEKWDSVVNIYDCTEVLGFELNQD